MVVLLVLDDGPRGIWCVGSSPLVLVNTGGFTKTFAPGVAVDLVVTQGKAVEAQGLVTPAFFVPGVGAVCSGYLGVTYVANQPLTKVNNLGQVEPPGGDGAIYVLGHKA